MTAYNPNVPLAKLYECTSKSGKTYYRGRLGLASIVLLKSDDVSSSGQPVWNLLVQEPASTSSASKVYYSPVADGPRLDVELEEGKRCGPGADDDPIPF